MGRPVIAYKITCANRVYNTIGNCVYKLFYNKRYVFVKAKNCYGSLKMIEKSLNQFMKGSDAQRKPDNLYLHLFNYVKAHKGGTWDIEIMSKPEDTEYQLLMLEEELITASKKDKNCLNNIKGAYINQWNPETQEYNWLPKPAVANFIRNKKKAISKGRKAAKSKASSASAKKSTAKKKSTK